MVDLPDILAEIIDHKQTELAQARSSASVEDLRSRAADAAPPRDMVAALRRAPDGPVRIIGEVKRRSPSAGLIREDFDAARLAGCLAAGGSDAISVLTDEKYFGGHLGFLDEVHRAVDVPVLRKDFIIDAYQVWEARAWGADALLLIADALDASLLGDLVALGDELGMAGLVESHDEEALARALASGAALVGVNNRDLRTFTVDLATTARLGAMVPADRILVAESGIACAADVAAVLAAGAQAVLAGESLMRSSDMATTLAEFKRAR
jgi:indole-3-glycerol phosphate synthase